jgi:hypothetical protein
MVRAAGAACARNGHKSEQRDESVFAVMNHTMEAVAAGSGTSVTMRTF